jgi:hypothetical protein
MQVVKHYKDVAGRKRVTGGKGLKATQAYPKQLGIDTAASYLTHFAKTMTTSLLPCLMCGWMCPILGTAVLLRLLTTS